MRPVAEDFHYGSAGRVHAGWRGVLDAKGGMTMSVRSCIWHALSLRHRAACAETGRRSCGRRSRWSDRGPAGVTKSKNPIDAFIARTTRRRACEPVGPADKRTLLRRVYLDLIGIPPTPAEQDAFLKDESPDAYEKVVDRLLAASSTASATPGTGSTCCATPTPTSG